MSSFFNNGYSAKRFMDCFIMEWDIWEPFPNLEFDGIWGDDEILWLKQSLATAFHQLWSEMGFKGKSAQYPSFKWTVSGHSVLKPIDFVLNVHEERVNGKVITKVLGIRIPEVHMSSKVDNLPVELNLSTRERQVLDLVALGHTNKEIAKALFISEHTVDGHRSKIYKKLGVRSFKELVRKLR